MTRRVLQLITTLPVGGAERVILDIVRRLDRSRYEPLVCCIRSRGALAAEVESLGVPFFCVERMRSKRFDLGAPRALAALIREQRVDLVQSHLYHANLYGRLAARQAGVPAIATVHNTYATPPKLARRIFNRLLGRWSARVIAVSEDIRRDIVRFDGVDERKIATISNGVDVERLATPLSRGEARARLGLRDGVLALVCVARLEEQKGHVHLLEALAALGTLPLKLFLVGDGRLREALEARAAALGLSDSVAFLGSRGDVPEILKAMDVFVLPSLWEGLSIAMLEAMAAGLPVVATDVGGVAQVLGDGEYGVKVPPRDGGALANAIRALADPGARAALAERGRKRVYDDFSFASTMRRLTALYDEVISAR